MRRRHSARFGGLRDLKCRLRRERSGIRPVGLDAGVKQPSGATTTNRHDQQSKRGALQRPTQRRTCNCLIMLSIH